MKFNPRFTVAVVTATLVAGGLTSTAQAAEPTEPAKGTGAAAVLLKQYKPLTDAQLRAADTSVSALRAAAKKAAKRPLARSASTFPISLRWEWWGVRVVLNRAAACWAAKGIPEAEALIQKYVPVPWNFVAIGVIRLHKLFIGAQMGDQGVELHFSWLTGGHLHWVAPVGYRKGC
jgi:hypothetical protein